MDKRMLQKTFREYKKTARTDFAITNPDSLGDCPGCVWASLVDKYGDDCHGIWAKAWKYGMNGGDDIEEDDSVVIAHDLTEDQAAVFYMVFSENYNITPSEYKWENARLEGGLRWHNRFEKALFNAIAFTEDKDWRYGDIESLSDILDYYAMAFTESGELVELADEPPYEK